MPDEIANALSTPASDAPADDTTPAVEPGKEPGAVAPPVVKEEPKASTKKKYKIKVDSQEQELEFDPSNDEEVVKHLQMSRAASKRMQEAAELRKVAMEFLDELKKNPAKVLSDPNIGVDIKKFAQDVMNNELKELEKSPEQREREKLTKELESLRKQASDKEKQAKEADFARIQAEQERKLETEISAALDVGGVPKTPRTVARMAEMMMVALQNNIDLSPKDVVGLVKNNTMSEFKEIIAAMSDDQMEDFLGKEVIKRLRSKNIAKAKAAQTTGNIRDTAASTQKDKVSTQDQKKLTIKEFLKV